MPSVSILIRLFNGVEYLSQSMLTVLQQTFTDWELLIGINGHGSDGGEAYRVAKYVIDTMASTEEKAKIRLINYPVVKGGAETMNALAKDAVSDWITILDVDDMWHPDKLQQQIIIRDALVSMPDVIGTRCSYFGAMSGEPHIPVGYAAIEHFKVGNPMINSSVMMRRELLSCTDHFYGMDDYDLWCRLILQNKKFYNIDAVLTYHRITPRSHYNSSGKQDPDALRKFYFG